MSTPERLITPAAPAPSIVPSDPFSGLVEVLAARVAERVHELLRPMMRPAMTETTTQGVVDKRAIAGALAVSQPTIDRMIRAGMPFETVNSRKRFDVTSCRAWAAARGCKPTTAPKRAANDDVTDDEIDDIAAAAGFRRP